MILNQINFLKLKNRKSIRNWKKYDYNFLTENQNLLIKKSIILMKLIYLILIIISILLIIKILFLIITIINKTF